MSRLEIKEQTTRVRTARLHKDDELPCKPQDVLEAVDEGGDEPGGFALRIWYVEPEIVMEDSNER